MAVAPVVVLVAADDEAIAPHAEWMIARAAETVEIASRRVAMVSHPDAVAGVIEAAARATVGLSEAAGTPA